MKRLCSDCEYLKGRKVGLVSWVYWCSKTGNGYDGKALGIRPWINKPHPKCPLKGDKQND